MSPFNPLEKKEEKHVLLSSFSGTGVKLNVFEAAPWKRWFYCRVLPSLEGFWMTV